MVLSTSVLRFQLVFLSLVYLTQGEGGPNNDTTDTPVWQPEPGQEPEPDTDTQFWGAEANEESNYTSGEIFTHLFEDLNPSDINGTVLFDGDIVLTAEQDRRIKAGIYKWLTKKCNVTGIRDYGEAFRDPLTPEEDGAQTRSSRPKDDRRDRKALTDLVYRWPTKYGVPVVPYLFYGARIEQTVIKDSMAHWMEHTCIRFERSNTTKKPHLQFFFGHGCWSYVGHIWFWWGQPVSLGQGCNTVGIIAHELGHALGFWHEQARSSRDEHVVVNMDNVIPGLEGNFATVNDNNYKVSYDYASDMHYGSRYFTHGGNMTIVTRDPLQQELLASRKGLTHRDKLLANRMYNCTGKWLENCTMTVDPCENEGYIGKNCTCVCPKHTIGENCSTVITDYYAHLRSEKTETITEKQTISVSFKAEKFTKYIIAPECMVPVVKFTKFNMYGMSVTKRATFCYYEFLNIRNGSDFHNGMIFCGDQIKPGDVFRSTTRHLVLYTESSFLGSTGWAAEVTFEDMVDCGDIPMLTPNPSQSSNNGDDPSLLQLNEQLQPNTNQQVVIPFHPNLNIKNIYLRSPSGNSQIIGIPQPNMSPEGLPIVPIQPNTKENPQPNENSRNQENHIPYINPFLPINGTNGFPFIPKLPGNGQINGNPHPADGLPIVPSQPNTNGNPQPNLIPMGFPLGLPIQPNTNVNPLSNVNSTNQGNPVPYNPFPINGNKGFPYIPEGEPIPVIQFRPNEPLPLPGIQPDPNLPTTRPNQALQPVLSGPLPIIHGESKEDTVINGKPKSSKNITIPTLIEIQAGAPTPSPVNTPSSNGFLEPGCMTSCSGCMSSCSGSMDPLAAYNGGTPLIRAAASGYIDIVSTLINNGADVDATLPDGSTAISVAAAMGYEKIVEVLLKANANPNIHKGICNGGP